jgi:imidazolonepropionase-like amidohydrolase
MHEAGIPFVAGTDNITGFTLHRELKIYVQAGISPAEALQIATRNGAKYTQLSDRTGTVAIGKLADLVMIDGDPTQDISAVRDASLVVKEGVAYYPAKIYESLGVQPFRPPPQVTVKR